MEAKRELKNRINTVSEKGGEEALEANDEEEKRREGEKERKREGEARSGAIPASGAAIVTN